MSARDFTPRLYQLNPTVMNRVWMERLRQKELLNAGKIKFDCASPVVSNDRKLRVAAEEHGEVAEAIDILENAKTPAAKLKALRHLQAELTQKAAVTIAWLESIEKELPTVEA